jgi:hypothetical protein
MAATGVVQTCSIDAEETKVQIFVFDPAFCEEESRSFCWKDRDINGLKKMTGR